MKFILITQFFSFAFGVNFAHFTRVVADHRSNFEQLSPFGDIHENHQRDFGPRDAFVNNFIRRHLIEVILTNIIEIYTKKYYRN